jgi:hypothetical protein
MIKLSHCARCVVFAVGFLLSTVFATPTWASVIYELHDAGSSAVIGTLRIAAPPASRKTGWSTTDPADLIALHLENSLFGLGTGNLLSTAATVNAALLSLDGSNLDVGTLDIAFLTIPSNPLDPTIDSFLSFVFGVLAGDDRIGLATIKTIPDGSQAFDDSLRFGDASVPEPGTAVLLMIGLAAAGRTARRKRR